jgi:amino acid permease
MIDYLFLVNPNTEYIFRLLVILFAIILNFYWIIVNKNKITNKFMNIYGDTIIIIIGALLYTYKRNDIIMNK